LISLPASRKSLGLKPKSQKTVEKIEKMISDLKTTQASSSKPSLQIKPISRYYTESDSSVSLESSDEDMKILEQNFGKVYLEPKLQRIYDKSKFVNFSKNWYSRPTPPDLQFEERFLQS
jgi:hypothetical protein